MCIWQKEGKLLQVPESEPLIAYKVLRKQSKWRGVPRKLNIHIQGSGAVYAVYSYDKAKVELGEFDNFDELIAFLQKQRKRIKQETTLHSPAYYSLKWEVGETVTATPVPMAAKVKANDGHIRYYDGTRSGIYCFKSLKAARDYLGNHTRDHVVVKIEVWGSVVEHKREVERDYGWQRTRAAAGYRAEHARIVKVYDDAA